MRNKKYLEYNYYRILISLISNLKDFEMQKINKKYFKFNYHLNIITMIAN